MFDFFCFPLVAHTLLLSLHGSRGRALFSGARSRTLSLSLSCTHGRLRGSSLRVSIAYECSFFIPRTSFPSISPLPVTPYNASDLWKTITCNSTDSEKMSFLCPVSLRRLVQAFRYTVKCPVNTQVATRCGFLIHRTNATFFVHKYIVYVQTTLTYTNTHRYGIARAVWDQRYRILKFSVWLRKRLCPG